MVIFPYKTGMCFPSALCRALSASLEEKLLPINGLCISFPTRNTFSLPVMCWGLILCKLLSEKEKQTQTEDETNKRQCGNTIRDGFCFFFIDSHKYFQFCFHFPPADGILWCRWASHQPHRSKQKLKEPSKGKWSQMCHNTWLMRSSLAHSLLSRTPEGVCPVIYGISWWETKLAISVAVWWPTRWFTLWRAPAWWGWAGFPQSRDAASTR